MIAATQVEPSGRSRVWRRILAYSASRGATEGLLAVRGVVLAALLGPAAFGVWALLRLSMRYAALVPLGVFRGLELELLAGGRSEAERKHASRVAFGFLLVASGVLAAIAVIASFLVADSRHVLVLRGFAAAALAEQLYGYVLVSIRVRQDLRRYATLETTHAALQLICVIALAWLAGLGGAFAGLALASVMTMALGARHVELRPVWDMAVLRRLLGEGWPIAFNMMLTAALGTADRWIVAGFGGVTMLGYYAFAAQVANLSVTFAWVIRTVIFPEVYRNARSDRAAEALRAHLERAVLPFARLFPPLLGAASILVGPVLAVFLPKYTEAIGPLRLFLLAGAASGIVNLAAIGVVAAGKQRQLPILSGLALAINLSLSFLAIRSGAGLVFVATASFIGQATFAAGVLALVRRESGADDAVSFVVRTLAPLAWCVTVVAAIGMLLPPADPMSAAIAFALYLVLLIPLVPAMRVAWHRVRV